MAITLHHYKKDGSLCGYVQRVDYKDGTKSIIPCFTPTDDPGVFDSGGTRECFPNKRTLYRIDECDLNKAICVVEGEKCADALWALDIQAVTFLGGANAVHLSDWSPFTNACQVFLLPDNDNPGKRAMRQVVDELCGVLPLDAIKWVALPGLPDKGDIIDYLRDRGITKAELVKQFIDLASPPPSSKLKSQEKKDGFQERERKRLIYVGAVQLFATGGGLSEDDAITHAESIYNKVMS